MIFEAIVEKIHFFPRIFYPVFISAVSNDPCISQKRYWTTGATEKRSLQFLSYMCPNVFFKHLHPNCSLSTAFHNNWLIASFTTPLNLYQQTPIDHIGVHYDRLNFFFQSLCWFSIFFIFSTDWDFVRFRYRIWRRNWAWWKQFRSFRFRIWAIKSIWDFVWRYCAFSCISRGIVWSLNKNIMAEKYNMAYTFNFFTVSLKVFIFSWLDDDLFELRKLKHDSEIFVFWDGCSSELISCLIPRDDEIIFLKQQVVLMDADNRNFTEKIKHFTKYNRNWKRKLTLLNQLHYTSTSMSVNLVHKNSKIQIQI